MQVAHVWHRLLASGRQAVLLPDCPGHHYRLPNPAQAALENLRWGAEYLMACHPADGTYIAQIGDPGADHAYWGRWGWAEQGLEVKGEERGSLRAAQGRNARDP